jgi:hypothetical protein
MFMPFGLLTRVPTVFLGFLLTGWTAALVYAGYGVVCLYLGIGLLRLKPISRTLGIYYSVFCDRKHGFLLSAAWIRRANVRADEQKQQHISFDTATDGISCVA